VMSAHTGTAAAAPRRGGRRATLLLPDRLPEPQHGVEHVVAEAAVEQEGLLVFEASRARAHAVVRVLLVALDDVAQRVLRLAEDHRLAALEGSVADLGLRDVRDARED